jgi:hypothetical protein
MALEPEGLVGDLGIGGGVGLAEAVGGESGEAAAGRQAVPGRVAMQFDEEVREDLAVEIGGLPGL